MQQDSILNQIYSIPAMVELLLREEHPELADQLEFSTLNARPTDLVSDQLDNRIPDMLLLVDRRGTSRKVLIHIEFQANVDPWMALRDHVYDGLAVQRLHKEHPELRRPGVLDVVSMVLYHGKRRWTAPLDVEEVVPGLTKRKLVEPKEVDPGDEEPVAATGILLGLMLPDQTQDDLWRRLRAVLRALARGPHPWLKEALTPMVKSMLTSVCDDPRLEEADSMDPMIEIFKKAHLEDRDEAWQEGRHEGRQEGRQEGPQEGRQEGRLEGSAHFDRESRSAAVRLRDGPARLATARRRHRPGADGAGGPGGRRVHRRPRVPRRCAPAARSWPGLRGQVRRQPRPRSSRTPTVLRGTRLAGGYGTKVARGVTRRSTQPGTRCSRGCWRRGAPCATRAKALHASFARWQVGSCRGLTSSASMACSP